MTSENIVPVEAEEIQENKFFAENEEEIQKEYEKTLAKEKEELEKIQKIMPTFKPNDFDTDFYSFFSSNPFFGSLTLEITKVFDITKPTAYIGVRPNGRGHEIVLGINPFWFKKLTDIQRQSIFKHELYHLIFQHIFSRAVGDGAYAKMHNVATDLAINSLIGEENLPKGCLTPGVHPLVHPPILDENGKQKVDPKTKQPMFDETKWVKSDDPYSKYIAEARKNESSDYYFEQLRRIQEEQGHNENEVLYGVGTIDDHDDWGNLPKEIQEKIRDKVKEMIEKGVKKADRDNSWGDIPLEIQEQIRKMISKEVDWRSVIRNFVGRVRSLDRISTIRKINKKMPYIHPGVKRPNIANFAVFMDQSGSVADEDVCVFFGELENLAKETVIDTYHFDTEIDLNSHTVWKKGKELPKPHRTRCGGTDFQSVANFVNKPENRGKWSGVIILTDGYAPTMGTTPGVKVLWVITETGTAESVRSGDLLCQIKKDKKFKKV